MDFWQIFTLIPGVIYIIYEIRQKNFMWVVGIATSLAAMWVFFQKGLYASFGLNTYYFITSFIGLWHWRRDKQAVSQDDVIVLNRLTWKTVVISAAFTVVGTLALMWGMQWLHQMELLRTCESVHAVQLLLVHDGFDVREELGAY